MARFTGDDLVYQTPRFESETDFPSLMDGIDKDTSCVVVQYTDILGRIKDLNAIAAKAHDVGALLVAVVTEPVALGAIIAPGGLISEESGVGIDVCCTCRYLGTLIH